MILDFNVRGFLPQLLPGVLQTPRTMAWLWVLVAPIRSLNLRVQQDDAGLRAAIARNGQVMVLRYLLNQEFSPTKGILVVDGVNPGEVIVQIPVADGIYGAQLTLLQGRVRQYLDVGATFTTVYI
jgi:hypothetical protein